MHYTVLTQTVHMLVVLLSPPPPPPLTQFLQTTVAEMVQQFEEQLSRYQAFWEVMDQLDREAWVLEPEHPTPACVFRRIVISKANHSSCIIFLDVNVSHPAPQPHSSLCLP